MNLEYRKRLKKLDNIVNICGKTDWNEFTQDEKMMTQNLVLLVGLLYKMCKVNLVIKSEEKDGLNSVNQEAIDSIIDESTSVVVQVKDAA